MLRWQGLYFCVYLVAFCILLQEEGEVCGGGCVCSFLSFGLCFSCACFLSVLKFVCVLIGVLNLLCVCFVFKFSCVFFFCTCFLSVFWSLFLSLYWTAFCVYFLFGVFNVWGKSKDLRAVATFLRSLMLAVDIDMGYQCCFEDRRTPAVLRLKKRVWSKSHLVSVFVFALWFLFLFSVLLLNGVRCVWLTVAQYSNETLSGGFGV